MKTRNATALLQRIDIIRVAAATALILLIPLVAMQFSNEVDWGLNDFIIIGVLLFGTGLLYELISKKLPSKKQRIIVGVILLIALPYLWAELAVGIFTTWGS